MEPSGVGEMSARRGAPRWSVYMATSWEDAQSLGSVVYFPHSIRPLGGPVREIDFRMDVLEIPGLTFGRTRYGPAIHMECGIIDNYHLIIPLRGSVGSTCGSQSFVATPGTAAFYNHSRRSVVERSRASDHLALKLDRTVLEEELARILGRSLREPVVFDMDVDLTTPQSQRWLGGLHTLRAALDDPRVLESQELLAAELRNLLVLGLLAGQRHNYTPELMSGGRTYSAPASVRQAVALLEEYPARAWTVGQLAAAVGVGVRTLQENFRRSLDMSPVQYLTGIRLDRAHRDLVQADPSETTVAAVAHAWGFAHLGRFSAVYRERFGRPPSATLRAARRTA